MKLEFCVKQQELDEDANVRAITQFSVAWTEDDVIEGGEWKLPLFTEQAEGVMAQLLVVPEGMNRVRAYYYVSVDGRRMFGKFVDEEA